MTLLLAASQNICFNYLPIPENRVFHIFFFRLFKISTYIFAAMSITVHHYTYYYSTANID